MKIVLLLACGIVASIPGLPLLIEGLWVPPNHATMFKGLALLIMLIVILVVINLKKIVAAWSSRAVMRFNAIIAGILILALVAHIILNGQIQVEHPQRGKVFFCLPLSGELKQQVNSAGGRVAAIEKYGIDEIEEQLFNQPGVNFIITMLMVLLIYATIFVCLAVLIAFNCINRNPAESVLLLEEQVT